MTPIANNTEYKKLSIIENDLQNISELVEFDDYSLGFTIEFQNELDTIIDDIFTLRLKYDKKRLLKN